jgi:acyl-CoA synthetase (AMP-forming)/AMP-acid ligase II
MSGEERLAHAGSRGYPVGPISASVRAEVVSINRKPLDGTTAPKWNALLLPKGEIGELIVTGEHVCLDYERNPEAVLENKIADPSGIVWHRMGDTGWFDEQNRFRIAGRVHSTIVRNAIAIHPQIVEQIAKGDDSRIRRAAAAGIPDPMLGERLVVVIESAAGVAAEVMTRLRTENIPVDELLITSRALPVDPRHNSKIDYPHLRQMIMNGRIR